MFRLMRASAPVKQQGISSCVVCVVLVLLVLGHVSARASDVTSTTPKRFLDIQKHILKTMKKTGVASVAVAVAKDGEIMWEEGFGWADKDKKIRATPHTIYHLASISKSMTATGLMRLVERGLVDLDVPANDYLGESKLVAYAGSANDATVRRIVFHTAGLPMHWNLIRVTGADERPVMDESIRRYGILVTAPGETYTYSNFGYGILDYIISRVSGVDYAEFMRDEVFEPLGMGCTSIQVDARVTGDVAQMYDGSQNAIDPYDFDHHGASAVLSSVHDLLRFGMYHLGTPLGDQKLILEESTLDRMHEEAGSSFEENDGRVVDYLLGSLAGIDLGGYRLWVTSGGMPGAVSRLVMVPAENVAVALVSNGDAIDLWSIEKAVLELLVSDFSGESVGAGSSAQDAKDGRTTPATFVGSWTGDIETYVGKQRVDMRFPDEGGASLRIDGEFLPSLGVRTPMGELGFKDGAYQGLFRGTIDTPDAAQAAHVLLVDCRPHGDRIVGTVSAVAVNQFFCLPHALVLSRAE